MRNKWPRLLLCAVVAAFTSLYALAPDESANKSDVRDITGCLTKSGGGNEYLLTGSDGSTWEIHENGAVNLAKHVNQIVEVIGAVANSKAHNRRKTPKKWPTTPA